MFEHIMVQLMINHADYGSIFLIIINYSFVFVFFKYYSRFKKKRKKKKNEKWTTLTEALNLYVITEVM